MRKFTVFTVILAITVIVTVSEMFVNNYLPNLQGEDGEELSLSLPESLDLSKIVKTDTFAADESGKDSTLSNRLGEDLTVENSETEAVAPLENIAEQQPVPAGQLAELYATTGSYDSAIPEDQLITEEEQLPSVNQNSSTQSGTDFEDQNYSAKGVSVNLRQEQIESAGFFSAYIENEISDGKLYKTIEVADLYDTKMQKFIIRSKEELMAKVYIFSVGSGTKIEELYQLIKSRCAAEPLVSINATNEFGSESFYMNDSSRSNTVFSTVRIGQLIYGFSYPKNYHQQVKNLIQLITWEID